jgi:hypothetical protein
VILLHCLPPFPVEEVRSKINESQAPIKFGEEITIFGTMEVEDFVIIVDKLDAVGHDEYDEHISVHNALTDELFTSSIKSPTIAHLLLLLVMYTNIVE